MKPNLTRAGKLRIHNVYFLFGGGGGFAKFTQIKILNTNYGGSPSSILGLVVGVKNSKRRVRTRFSPEYTK
jgi:hypothetical protein